MSCGGDRGLQEQALPLDIRRLNASGHAAFLVRGADKGRRSKASAAAMQRCNLMQPSLVVPRGVTEQPKARKTARAVM